MVAGREELARYPSVTFVRGEAETAQVLGEGFHVRLADGEDLAGARLVLALGVRDELPAVSGVEERWGVSVLHCPYCDGYEYSGQALGVLAAGPSSIHQALLISDWGPTTLFTQEVIEPDAEQLAKLAARGVRVERTPVIDLHGQASALDAVTLEDGRAVPLKALFVAPRTHMVNDLPSALGCAFEEGPTGPYVRVDGAKLTSVTGVYAAGDLSSPMPNATLAAASGVIAGAMAHQSLIFG